MATKKTATKKAMAVANAPTDEPFSTPVENAKPKRTRAKAAPKLSNALDSAPPAPAPDPLAYFLPSPPPPPGVTPGVGQVIQPYGGPSPVGIPPGPVADMAAAGWFDPTCTINACDKCDAWRVFGARAVATHHADWCPRFLSAQRHGRTFQTQGDIDFFILAEP